jgi:hypothetical protein
MLISSFFSAIQKFNYQMGDKKNRYINSLSLGESVFNFLIDTEYELYFVSRSSNKIKHKEINRHLKEIQKMFISEFEENIKKFEGEVTQFDKFKETFENYFQDKFIKLKSMW